MRKKWDERLRQRMMQENCYLSWARIIAETAKYGFLGQEKLEWDSYETMKSDFVSQCLQRKAERAKEIAKLRAEETARIRAEIAARQAQLRKEKEEKAKKKKEEKAKKKAEDMKMKMKMALSKSLKCQARLNKVPNPKRKRSSASIQKEIVVEPQEIVDNLDINLIKIEQMRRKVSLADQIQAVRNRKRGLNSK